MQSNILSHRLLNISLFNKAWTHQPRMPDNTLCGENNPSVEQLRTRGQSQNTAWTLPKASRSSDMGRGIK